MSSQGETSRLALLGAAAKRFVLILAGAAAVTGLLSLVAALVLGTGVDRAVSVGYYLAGCFLLVGGFFIGNRGPARPKGVGPTLFGPRFMRWSTPDEREDALNTSAIFVAIGFVLLLLGALLDSRVRLV